MDWFLNAVEWCILNGAAPSQPLTLDMRRRSTYPDILYDTLHAVNHPLLGLDDDGLVSEPGGHCALRRG